MLAVLALGICSIEIGEVAGTEGTMFGWFEINIFVAAIIEYKMD